MDGENDIFDLIIFLIEIHGRVFSSLPDLRNVPIGWNGDVLSGVFCCFSLIILIGVDGFDVLSGRKINHLRFDLFEQLIDILAFLHELCGLENIFLSVEFLISNLQRLETHRSG